MFRKNVVIQITDDIDNFPKGTRWVATSSDAAYTMMVMIGGTEEDCFEEMTDQLMDHLHNGKIKIEGPRRLKMGEVYFYHKDNIHIVPQMKVTSKASDSVIVVYRTVNKKIKLSDRLSNQSYFITMNEFVMNCEYAGEF